MKKLLIYIFLSSLVGCNEPEEWIGNGSGYSKYLVQNYVDGSYVLYGMLAEKPSTLYSMSGFQVLLEDPVYYQTPEQEGAQHTDDFLRIAERNHDTEYNNLKSLPWSDLTAFADNFTGIKVTSDKDWSAKYPAGSPLNDKMGVRYVSYAEYIENDYHSYSDLGKEILFLYNKTVVGFATRRSAGGRIHSFLLVDLLVYTLFYVGSRQSGRSAYFYGGVHHFGWHGQDRLDNLHAGGRSCVAIAGSTNSGNCKIADPQWIGYLSCHIRTLFLPGFGNDFLKR